MNKKISLGAAIAFALIVAAAVFSVTMVYAQQSVNQTLSALQQREAFYNKFSEIDREVRKEYYGEINEKGLQDATARGFLAGLEDPYARYYSPEEYRNIEQKVGGKVAGVGIVGAIVTDGYIEISDVYLDSPAAVAGIAIGSTIIEINDEHVTVDTNEQLLSSLEGADGSKITLTIRSDAGEQYYDLTRRVIMAPTVVWTMLPDSGVAYIRISDFDHNTSNQFNRAFKEIQEAGGRAIIFDLRSNSAKDLASASRILDRLVPSGPLITIQRTTDEGEIVQVLDNSDSNELAWPMAVLINGETSGAAEMFAQVLVDYEKARLVGTTTAGRGIVSEVINLSDGSAIELTVGMYQSPVSKITFVGDGLRPDYDVKIAGLEKEGDWIKLPLDYDLQLKKAIEVVTVS